MFAEDPILFQEIRDDVLLAVIHPTGDGEDQELKKVRTHAPESTSFACHGGPSQPPTLTWNPMPA